MTSPTFTFETLIAVLKQNDKTAIQKVANDLLEYYETDDFKIGINEFKTITDLSLSVDDPDTLLLLCSKSLFFESSKPGLAKFVRNAIIANDTLSFTKAVVKMGSFVLFPILFSLDLTEQNFQESVLRLVKLDLKGVLLCLSETNAHDDGIYTVYDMLVTPFLEDIQELNTVINTLSSQIKIPSSFATTLVKFVVYLIPKHELCFSNANFNKLLLKEYSMIDDHYCQLLYNSILLEKCADYSQYTKSNELQLLCLMVKHTTDIDLLKYLFPWHYIHLIPLFLNKFNAEGNSKYIKLVMQVFETVDISADMNIDDFISSLLLALIDVANNQDLQLFCKELLLFSRSLIEDTGAQCTAVSKDSYNYLANKLGVEALNIDTKELEDSNEDILDLISDKEPSVIGYGLHMIQKYDELLFISVLTLFNSSDPFVVLSAIQCIIRMSSGKLDEIVNYIFDKELHNDISWLFNMLELLNKLVLLHGENIFATKLIEIPLRLLTTIKSRASKYTSIALSRKELAKITEELEYNEELMLSRNVLRGSCLSILQYSVKYAIKSVLPYLSEVILTSAAMLVNATIFEARAISLILAEIVMNDNISDATLTSVIDERIYCEVAYSLKACSVSDEVFDKNAEIVLEGLRRLPIARKQEKSMLRFL